ncbi:RNA polymerase sporulation-specific sigma factor [Hydrogenispora ethanolica]|uniref:RNA polymerase sporulation-specific sigma factor n=1 Tax=Hydrogenispora ethanolica TaxID=1082276 RepID=A0A4R1R938_HYDET|nr:sigma-70 family RNA polymerase sigma factor [Hydrogenispora ethanolica]TCL62205.1 RNA polymerase sporulation-specific sigma factor [Hydrogenispora ethanolica]
MIQQYLAELSKIRLLSQAEESLLWENFKVAKSREARQRIIESYQPLVYKIASRITGLEDLFFDLIQEGTVGLIEATESFDPNIGVKFSTFAQHRIRGRMIDYLKRQRSNQDSLEIALNGEELEGWLLRIADNQVNVEEEVSLKLIGQQVNRAISRLNAKEQKVIYDLYMFDKEPVVSAQEMKISLSYYYKIQKKALQRLRGMLSKLRAELKISS